MERRRNLVRRVAPAGLALLVIGLTGCGGDGPVGRPPAAVVDGREISPERVLALSKAYAAYAQVQVDDGTEAGLDESTSSAFADLVSEVEGSRGDGADTYGTERAAASLEELMVYEAVLAELDRNDIEVDAAAVESARKELDDGILQNFQSATGDDGEAVTEAEAKEKLDAIPDHLLDVTARTQAAEAALAPLMTPVLSEEEQEARVQELFEESKVRSPICISAAYAIDEDAAGALKERADDGEDFADLAGQTINPTSGGPGGPFGCGTEDQVASLVGVDPTTFEVGQVIGPIGPVSLTQDGQTSSYLVVQVTSLTGDTLERARPALEQEVQQELTPPDPSTEQGRARLQEKGLELLAKAEVTVDTRYGTWNAASGVVVPPFDPLAPVTTTTPVPGATATDPSES